MSGPLDLGDQPLCAVADPVGPPGVFAHALQQVPLRTVECAEDGLGRAKGSPELLVGDVVRDRGEFLHQRGVILVPRQPLDEVCGVPGRQQTGRTRVGQAQCLGVLRLAEGAAYSVDGLLHLLRLRAHRCRELRDVAGEQHRRHSRDAEQGGRALPRGGELALTGLLLGPQDMAGPDRLEGRCRRFGLPVVDPGPVGQQRVGGDQQAADLLVQAGPTKLGDPLADVLHLVLTGYLVLGGVLVDPPAPLGAESKRAVVDLSELQRVHDLLDDGHLPAVEFHAPGAVLHGLGDPAEYGLQLGRGDRLAVTGRVEVGVLRVELLEDAIRDAEHVALETGGGLQPGLVAGQHRQQVAVLPDRGAGVGLVQAADAVQLGQRDGELGREIVTLRLELVAHANAVFSGVIDSEVVEPLPLQQVVDLQEASELAGPLT